MAIVKLKTGSGEEITIDDTKRLGKGGEGSVYAVQTPAKYSRYCIKEYSPAILADSKRMAERQAKVEYMAKNKVESSNSGIVICWPVEAIFRNGRFVGFMMLKAFDQSKELEWFVSYNLMKVINKTPFCSFDGSNGLTALYNRLVVANNLAHALHTIHSTNHYVLADTKPKNILITSTGNVSIVDLDSLQIVVNDQLKFKAPVASPNYKPPEGYDGRLNQESDIIPISWDRFSYAVMAYELIIGSHPYGVGSYKSPYDQGEDTMYKIRTGLFLHGSKSPYLRTEHEASLATIRVRWNGLPEPLRQLFMTAFEKGQFKPEKRPTMQDWGKVLSDSITGLQGVLQKKPSAASPAVAAAGRPTPASEAIAAARQSELVAAKQPPMTTPTHTTFPGQPLVRPAPISPAGQAGYKTLPPLTPPVPTAKKGLSNSDKVVLSSLALVGFIAWGAAHLPDSRSPYGAQASTTTTAESPQSSSSYEPSATTTAPLSEESAAAQAPVAEMSSSPPSGSSESVDAPNIRPGMLWHLKTTDVIHPKNSYADVLFKIDSVSDSGMQVEKRVISRNAGHMRASAPTMLTYDTSWNLVSGVTGSYSPALQYYDFPLKVGKKWESTSTIVGNPGKDSQTANGEVKGWQDLQTAFGNVHALKVVVIFTSTLNGQVVSRGADVSWYAPDVKRAVRTEESIWLDATQEWKLGRIHELTSYSGVADSNETTAVSPY